MEIKFFIDGQEVHHPANIEELAIDVNFDKDATKDGEPVKAVSLNDIEWGLGDVLDAMDGAKIINDYKISALTTGKGLFVGLPLTIEVSENGQTFTFEKVINVGRARFDCDKVFVPTLDRKQVDWLRDNVDGVSYRTMFEDGEFTSADFIPMPYVNSELPENREIIISVISLFITVASLVEQIQQFIELVAGAAIVPFGINDAVKLFLRLFYIFFLFATIINLFKNIVRSMIQPTKYIHGMKLNRLLEIGAAHFDLVYESPILQNDPWDRAVVFPTKELQTIQTQKISLFGGVLGMSGQSVSNNIFGYQNPNDPNARGYFKGTFGDLLRRVEAMIKGKIVIDGNKMKILRKDENTSAPNYVLPPIDDTDYTLNVNEMIANYGIRFLYDYNDKNTVQRVTGVETTVATRPTTTTDPDMVFIENAQEEIIEFAKGARKEDLTPPEEIIQSIIDLVSSISGIPPALLGTFIFPGIGNPNNRIGMLLMENDYVAIDKICLVDVNSNNPAFNKISTDNDSVINTSYLWSNYHKPVVSFIPSNEKPNANQYVHYDIEGVPGFCFSDYAKLVNNNKIKTANGETAEAISARWLLKSQRLDINYKINKLYDKKLKETATTHNGR